MKELRSNAELLYIGIRINLLAILTEKNLRSNFDSKRGKASELEGASRTKSCDILTKAYDDHNIIIRYILADVEEKDVYNRNGIKRKSR